MNQPTFIQQFFENKLDGLNDLKSNTSKNKFLFKANLKIVLPPHKRHICFCHNSISQPKGKRAASPTLYSL
jgi:hypothetical protein